MSPEPLSFVSQGEGARQRNLCKVYSGLYGYAGQVAKKRRDGALATESATIMHFLKEVRPSAKVIQRVKCHSCKSAEFLWVGDLVRV